MALRKKQRPRGRPFPKGHVANPNGRPKMTPEQRAEAACRVDLQVYARTFTREATDKLVALMRGDKVVIGDDTDGAPLMGRPSIAIQKESAVELLNRGWGTPHTAIEVDEVVHHVVAEDLVERLDRRIAGIRERFIEQGILPRFDS